MTFDDLIKRLVSLESSRQVLFDERESLIPLFSCHYTEFFTLQLGGKDSSPRYQQLKKEIVPIESRLREIGKAVKELESQELSLLPLLLSLSTAGGVSDE